MRGVCRVAPNIFYLGFAGIINYGGLRIGGISGIYNEHHYYHGHYEAPPFNDKSLRSMYHVREYEVFQLSQVTQPVDIMLSHDWPRGIYNFGDKNELLRKKKFLKAEVADGSLGSPPNEHLLHTIQPEYWFSAHLHVKFPAVVVHPPKAAAPSPTPTPTPAPAPAPPGGPAPPVAQNPPRLTKFLALDKCLPRRHFLQVVDFPQATGPLKISFDAEWLAIVRCTHQLRGSTRQKVRIPQRPGNAGPWKFQPSKEDIGAVTQLLQAANQQEWPENFEQTVAVYHPDKHCKPVAATPTQNAQTTLFCKLVQIPNPCSPGQQTQRRQPPPHNPYSNFMAPPAVAVEPNPDEIDLDDDDLDDASAGGSAKTTANPNKSEVGTGGATRSVPPPARSSLLGLPPPVNSGAPSLSLLGLPPPANKQATFPVAPTSACGAWGAVTTMWLMCQPANAQVHAHATCASSAGRWPLQPSHLTV